MIRFSSEIGPTDVTDEQLSLPISKKNKNKNKNKTKTDSRTVGFSYGIRHVNINGNYMLSYSLAIPMCFLTTE